MLSRKFYENIIRRGKQMKRFIPPSVPFTEKWSIEMKKVLSVVSLIMGIVPFSLLFIWKQEFMRQSPVNYIVIGGVVIVIGAGFVIALYQFKSRHFRDLVTKMALILNSLFLATVVIVGVPNIIFRIMDLLR